MDGESEKVSQRLLGLVQRLLGESAPATPFPMKLQLTDLGISSLKMVNLMLAVEMEFDICIPQGDITPENFHSLTTVQALVLRNLTRSDD